MSFNPKDKFFVLFSKLRIHTSRKIFSTSSHALLIYDTSQNLVYKHALMNLI